MCNLLSNLDWVNCGGCWSKLDSYNLIVTCNKFYTVCQTFLAKGTINNSFLTACVNTICCRLTVEAINKV